MSENNGQIISKEELDSLAESIPTRTTDVATRREMVLSMLRQSHAVTQEVAPDVPLDQSPPKPKVYPPKALAMARVWLWLIAQVQTPYRTKRAAIAMLRAPVKAWSFLRVVTSKQASPYEKAERDDICSECPFRHFRMRRTAAGIVMDEHCSKCGCPDWYFSRNEVRNAYSGWKCPARKHAGPYPDDDLREHLKANGYDPENVNGSGGCTGCGCGKAARQGG